MSTSSGGEHVFCFIPDSNEVFVIAQVMPSVDGSYCHTNIVDLRRFCEECDGNAQVNIKVAVDLLPRGAAPQEMGRVVLAKTVVPIDNIEELQNPPADLIKLMYVQRPTILYTLRQRFMRDEIYTAIGPILVAINPFKWIDGIYSKDRKESYQCGSSTLSDNPHVFAVAHDALHNLQLMRRSQSLIISGESGAGKTEATKQCLNYLAHCAGSASGIQEKILKASPILEAWGNAKTLRNNNSSRFGKFIEIWFDNQKCSAITGSSNTTYILEKSRVVFQEIGERNYHVFYQMLFGSSSTELEALGIKDLAADPGMIHYINQSGCLTIDEVDDGADYAETNAAFDDIGFNTKDERTALYHIISGILLLGNVVFEVNPANSEESQVRTDDQSEEWLRQCAHQFKIDIEMLRKALLFKKIQSGGGKRTSIAFASYLPSAAAESRDALTKEVYSRCFDWIVAKINSLVHSSGSDRNSKAFDMSEESNMMIGILDIFGFEIFQKNSLEQLCINLANEALQQHFNYNIFQAEMDIYVAEDVPVPPLDFRDNQDVLDLIIKPPRGLIPMLDEEGRVPRGSWEGFYNKFVKASAGHERFKLPPVSSKANNRGSTKVTGSVVQSKELGIVHYAGVVYYDPFLFLVKNKDTLSPDLLEVFAASQMPLLHSLFNPEGFAAVLPSGAEVAPPSRGKRTSTVMETKMTVGKKFSLQLDELIRNLNSTKPRYIRCIKPNQVKKPNIFVPDLTNEQLTYSGVFEAVIIMQNGYPFRLAHTEYRSMYHMLIGNCSSVEHEILFDEDQYAEYMKNGASAVTQRFSSYLSTKRIRSFSRQQCQFMVDMIASSNQDEELSKCHVGKTRTFFKVQQHQLLVKLRDRKMQYASILIQKRARSHIVRGIVVGILEERHRCISAIVARDIPAVKSAADMIERLLDRLNAVVEKLQLKVEIATIGRNYVAALELEASCVSRISAIIDVEMDLDTKFQQLNSILTEARTINFVAQYEGIELKLDWRKNMRLLDYSNRINDMGRIIDVQSAFRHGIAEVDEIKLEKALSELQSLRSTGKVDETFCAAEEVSALAAVEAAKRKYEIFLDTVLESLQQGRLQLRSKSDSLQFDIDVDPSCLDAVLSGQSQDTDSVRIEKLTELCRELRHLRQLALEARWSELWSIIYVGMWKDIAEYNKNQSNSEFVNNLQRDSFNIITEIPSSVLNIVAEELHNMSICSITYFVVPNLEQAAAAEGIPIVPVLRSSRAGSSIEGIDCEESLEKNIVETKALQKQMEAIASYREYFDERLRNFICMMEETLALRVAVNERHPEPLRKFISNARFLSKDGSDIQNAQRFLLMYDLVANAKSVFTSNEILEEVGFIDLEKLDILQLSSVVEEMNSLTVSGDVWQDLVAVCVNFLELKDVCRRCAQDCRWDAALELLQRLEALNVWKHVGNSLTLPDVQTVVNIAYADFQKIRLEVHHRVAYLELADSLENHGHINGNLNDRNLNAVNPSCLQDALERLRPRIVETPDAVSLFVACEMIIKIRTAFTCKDWASIEMILNKLLPANLRQESLRESRILMNAYQSHPLDIFSGSHCSGRAEMVAAYRRYFDFMVERELKFTLESGAPYFDDEGGTLDVTNMNLSKILNAIHFAHPSQEVDGRYDLSHESMSMLLCAKACYCVRSLLLSDRWEPEEIIPFGSAASRDLPILIPKLFAEGKLDSSILIENFKNLDMKLSIKAVDSLQKLKKLEVGKLSIAEVLSLLSTINSDSLNVELIEKDISYVRSLSLQRQLKSLVLIAACSGCTTGSIDELDIKNTDAGELEAVINHVQEHLKLASISLLGGVERELLFNWLEAAKNLLVIRKAVLASRHASIDVTAKEAGVVQSNFDRSVGSSMHVIDAAAADVKVESCDLGDLLEPEFIEDTISKTSPGFPLDEMSLVLLKLRDRISFLELTRAMEFGRPSFVQGKFDISRVEHGHLLERLDSCRRVSRKRSDRLDRLFFYVEMCVNLRTAIAANQWELSARGEKAVTDRSIITVKKCMEEFEQAGKFFRNHIDGVPPRSVIEEFSSVRREWDRRLVKQTLSAAFTRGTVVGMPFKLKLSQVRTEMLEAGIQRAYEVETESGEEDEDVRLFVRAAEELLGLRVAARKLHENSKAKIFPLENPLISLRDILQEKSFLPDAVDTAVGKVLSLREYPYPALMDWQQVAVLASKASACYSVPVARSEVELLVGESYARIFTSETIKFLAASEAIAFSNQESLKDFHKVSEIIEGLTQAVGSYQEHWDKLGQREGTVHSSAGRYLANSHSSEHRCSATLEILFDSAVAMIHLLHARNMKAFDFFARDWSLDKNFDHTPRFAALRHDITAMTGKYSVQQVYRSAKSIPKLHENVNRLLKLVEQEVNDAVSHREMLYALENANMIATGSIDEIKFPDVVERDTLSSTLARLDEVGVYCDALQPLLRTFKIVTVLRQACATEVEDYDTAWDSLCTFCCINGRKDLHNVLHVLIDEDNYVIEDVARVEFLLLAQYTCDRVWQRLAEKAMLNGCVLGTRGCLHGHRINWEKLDEIIDLCDALAAPKSGHRFNVSAASTYMLKVCHLVKSIRQQLHGPLNNEDSSAHNFGNFKNVRNDDNDCYARIDLVMKECRGEVGKENDFAKFAEQILGDMNLLIISESVTNIECIGRVNCMVYSGENNYAGSLVQKRSILNSVEQLQDILMQHIDSMGASESNCNRNRCSNDGSIESNDIDGKNVILFSSTTTTTLVDECSLVKAHVESALAQSNLLHSLITIVKIKFGADGLQCGCDTASKDLSRTIIDGMGQGWSAVLSYEYWCVQVLELLKVYNEILTHQRVDGKILPSQVTRRELLLIPGTKEFFCQLPKLSFLCATAKSLKKKMHDRVGFLKLSSFPWEILTDVGASLTTAISEHSVLQSLDSIVRSEHLVTDFDCQGIMEIKVQRLHPVTFTFSGTSYNYESFSHLPYEDQSAALLSAVLKLAPDLKLTAGKQLLSLVELLIKFRVSVSSGKWALAQDMVQGLQWIALFPSRSNDINTFTYFAQYTTIRRRLELGILTMRPLALVGWSLQDNYDAVVMSIDPKPLQHALHDVRRDFVDLLDSDQALQQLVKVGEKLLEILEALHQKLWVLPTDIEKFISSAPDSIRNIETRQKPVPTIFKRRRSSIGRSINGATSMNTAISSVDDSISTEIKTGPMIMTEEKGFACPRDGIGPGGKVLASRSRNVSFQRPSIFALKADLDALLSEKCSAIKSSPLFNFLIEYSNCLYLELAAIQLEYAVQYSLNATRLTGKAGELVFDDSTLQRWTAVLELLDMHSGVATMCAQLIAATQGLQIMSRFLVLHKKGNASELKKYVDLLAFLCQLPPQPVQSPGHSFSSRRADLFAEEVNILSFDDFEYSHLVSDECSRYGANVNKGTAETKEMDDQGNLNAGNDKGADLMKPALRKVFKVATGNNLSTAMRLRDEIAVCVELFRKHATFEFLYSEFSKCIDQRPAGGQAGELITDVIEYDRLEELLEHTCAEGMTEQQWLWGASHILFQSVNALLLIRQGQKLNDEAMIRSGVDRAKETLTAESNYCVLPEAKIMFGQATKVFLKAAESEIKLADNDLMQRFIAKAMRSALESDGLPLNGYPFDLSKVKLKDLEYAYNECDRIQPCCESALQLYWTTKVVLSLRSFAVKEAWQEMLEYIADLNLDEDNDLPLDPSARAECTAAIEIATVNRAVDAARDAYKCGFLSGSVGDVFVSVPVTAIGSIDSDMKDSHFDSVRDNSCSAADTTKLNVDGLLEAMVAFDCIKELWMNDEVIKHKNAIQCLHSIRLNIVQEDWKTVHELASIALNPYNLQFSKPIPSECLAEITLSHDHAIYMIVCAALKASLDRECGLRGQVGAVSTESIQVEGLIEAYTLAVSFDCTHEDVLRLMNSVELLFRVRRAVLLGRWIPSDVTQAYTHLLSSNFQPRHEAVDQVRILQMTIISRNNVIGDASDASDEKRVVQDQSTTVECLIPNFVVLNREGAVVNEALLELQLAFDEAKYRRTVSDLIKAIHSSGCTGIPGNLDPSTIATRTLEKAIHSASNQLRDIFASNGKGSISHFPHSPTESHIILRDAKLLLQARRFHLGRYWSDLVDVILRADAIQKKSTRLNEQGGQNYDLRVHSGGSTTESTHSSIRVLSENVDNGAIFEPIIEPVWEELNLLRSDCIFHLCLSTFAKEMMRKIDASADDIASANSVAYVDNSSSLLWRASKLPNAVDIDPDRVAAVRAIFRISLEAYEEYPSVEFERLVEATETAIELREFCVHSPTHSPQNIINRVAEVKKRDASERVPSYMSLLIFEISQMSNVLDFPLNLQIIHREIVSGHRYINSPLGTLDLSSTGSSLEVLSAAYHSAQPSLEIMGTEENRCLMHLADVVIAVRSALLGKTPSGQKYSACSGWFGSAHNNVGISGNDAVNSAYTAMVEGCRDLGAFATRSDSYYGEKYDLKGALAIIADREEDLMLHSHNQLSQPPYSFVMEEIARLRLEAENEEACALLDNGLRNGRYIDVLSIAKMVNQHDRVMADRLASVGEMEFNALNRSNEEHKREHGRGMMDKKEFTQPGVAAKKAARRISVTVAALLSRIDDQDNNFEDSCEECTPIYDTVKKEAHQLVPSADFAFQEPEVSANLKSLSKASMHSTVSFKIEGERFGDDVPDNAVGRRMVGSPPDIVISGRKRRETAKQYIHNVLSSIDALNEAVERASKVQAKTPATIYYLDAAKVILELRQNIVEGEWDEVRRITQEHTSRQDEIDLPATALEEISAVKEGLAYQDCMARICRAFVNGTTEGSPHDLLLPSCDELERAVAISTQLKFVDQSAKIMIELGRKILDIRRCLQYDRWILSDDDDHADQEVLESFYHKDADHIVQGNSDLVRSAVHYRSLPLGMQDSSRDEDTIITSKKYTVKNINTSELSAARQQLIQRQVDVADYCRHKLDMIERHSFASSINESDRLSRAYSVTTIETGDIPIWTRLATSAPLTPSVHHKMTVELSVASYLRFQNERLPQLQSLLGVHIRSSAERVLFPSVEPDAENDILDDNIAVNFDSSHEWIKQQWDAVCRVQTEVRLVQHVIHYRKVILSLESAMQLVPDPVRIFMGDLEIPATIYWSQYHGDRYYDDAVLSGNINMNSRKEQQRRKRRSQVAFTSFLEQDAGNSIDKASSLLASSDQEGKIDLQLSSFANIETKDIFCVRALRMAIKFAKSYLVSIDYDTSEDLLLLLHSSSLLLDFRTAMTEKSSRNRLQELCKKMHRLQQEKTLSVDCGLYELNAYESAVEESDLIYGGLIDSMSRSQVRGPLDKLSFPDAVDLQRMNEWIDRGRVFLSRGGAELSIDLVPILEQAKVLSKLRSMISKSDWEGLSRVILLHRGQAAQWDYAGPEFQHIFQAFRFRRFQLELYKALANFRSSEDLEHGLAGLQIDYHCLNQAFGEFLSILDYSSPLLYAHEIDREQLVSNEVHAECDASKECDHNRQRCYILSDSFFSESSFIASKALWRLMNAVLFKRWFVKQRIHNNPQQLVAANIDNFLFSFFGLANADYIENVYSISHMRETVESLVTVHHYRFNNLGESDAAQTHHNKESILRDAEETVFSVLVATNWLEFPNHVQRFFELARNRLVDIYIRSDLIYYCSKGATRLDTAGNVVLSDLFLRFLDLSVEDSGRAVSIANQLLIPFSWCSETEKWIRAARLIVQCRKILIELCRSDSPVNLEKQAMLFQLLWKQGLLQDIKSCNLSNEVNVAGIIVKINESSQQNRNLSWRLVPHLSAVEGELSVLQNYCYGFHAEGVLLRAVRSLSELLMKHTAKGNLVSSSFFSRVWGSEEVKECNYLVVQQLPHLNPSPFYKEVLQCASQFRAALFAAQEGKHVRLTFCLNEVTDFIATQTSHQWIEVFKELPSLSISLKKLCCNKFHADLLEAGVRTFATSETADGVSETEALSYDSKAMESLVSMPSPSSRGKSSSRKFFGTDLSQTRFLGSMMTAAEIRKKSLHSLSAHKIWLEETTCRNGAGSSESASDGFVFRNGVNTDDTLRGRIAIVLYSLQLMEEEFQMDKQQQWRQQFTSDRRIKLRKGNDQSRNLNVPISQHAFIDLPVVLEMHHLCFHHVTKEFAQSDPIWVAALLITLLHLHHAVAREVSDRKIIVNLWSAAANTAEPSDTSYTNCSSPLAQNNLNAHRVSLSHDLVRFLADLELENYLLSESVLTSNGGKSGQGENYASIGRPRQRSCFSGESSAKGVATLRHKSVWMPAVIAISKHVSFLQMMKQQNRSIRFYSSTRQHIIGNFSSFQNESDDLVVEHEGIDWIIEQLKNILPDSGNVFFAANESGDGATADESYAMISKMLLRSV